MTRLLSALLCALLFVSPVYAGTGTITTKDEAGATKTFDVITDGSGNFGAMGGVCDGAALAQCQAVKAASTAPVATDPAAVVTLSQNAGLGSAATPMQVSLANTGANATAVLVNQPTGTNLHSVVDSGTITTVSTVSASRLVGNAGGVLDAIGQNVAAPANWLQAGCQFQTTPTTITATNGSPLQCDNAANLLVNVKNANANVGNNVDAVATSGTAGSPVVDYLYGFNGSTWDRQFSINNQFRVQVAQTVQAAAYASGNAVGGLMTIANAARVSGSLGASGTGGILQNVAVNSKSVQTAQMDIFIFDANPSGSTCTDKTAFVLATADFDKVIGVISVPGSVTNNNGWFSGGTGSVGQAENQAMAYAISAGTSLFACMVTRGTPTFAATTDISLKYQFMRN